MKKNNSAIKIDGLEKPLSLKNISFLRGGISLNRYGLLSAYPIIAAPIKRLSNIFSLTKRTLNFLSISSLAKHTMQLHKNNLKMNITVGLRN